MITKVEFPRLLNDEKGYVLITLKETNGQLKRIKNQICLSELTKRSTSRRGSRIKLYIKDQAHYADSTVTFAALGGRPHSPGMKYVVKHMIKPLHAEGLIVWLNDAPEYGEMQRSWRGAKFHEKVYCVFFNTKGQVIANDVCEICLFSNF
ncbi:unnamed protein product [Albugo candida]|uniref:Uncharacterized protein n=1 Tax=Albugo candida TaxID=65357 RepID=A0A024GQX8_9STRA|nr:unnamed protein product [Albugo candida]|eukprot:CCI49138.1 unnamed protein product [Albugo candida]